MRSNRIEFISNTATAGANGAVYDRCAASRSGALGMCGDLKEALQLAVGVPMAVAPGHPELEFVEPTPRSNTPSKSRLTHTPGRSGKRHLRNTRWKSRSRASMVP